MWRVFPKPVTYCKPNITLHTYIPVILAVSGSLACPIPYLLNAFTLTTTLPVNTPFSSKGALNVSVVIELLTFMDVPL